MIFRNCSADEVTPSDLYWHPPLYLTRSLYGYDSDDDSDKWNPPGSTADKDLVDDDNDNDSGPFGAQDHETKMKMSTSDEEVIPDYLIDAD